jgi:glycosyltransferase involved in cell wall biosynthesis
MKKVLILYKFLPQYRVDFFNQLKEELYRRDIELTLIYGKMKDSHSSKKDEVDLPWAIYRENKVINIGNSTLLWQPSLDYIKQSDVVIVEQANKLIINYYLMFMRIFSKRKFSFWGHGRNMQGEEKGLKNKLKYFYIGFCDYWFAYTDGVKDFIISKNVSPHRITVVNNAIDTKTLREQYIECNDIDVINTKKELNISSSNIAIYSGSLYDIKKIDFLIESAVEIRKSIDDFQLIVIGSGSDSYIVEEASKKFDWIHAVGAKFGKDRVVYFKMASLFMLPGAVGLAILDSFATQTPMVTTDMPLHGPEIDYLKNDINGAMTTFDIDEYSKKVISLFKDKVLLNTLEKGCIDSSEAYTVEHMVDRFANGVEECLKY